MREWLTPEFQIQADNTTIWVHSVEGFTVARFGVHGIDVHTADATGCLDCSHGSTGPHEWLRFVVAMEAHYGLDVRPYVPDRITYALIGYR